MERFRARLSYVNATAAVGLFVVLISSAPVGANPPAATAWFLGGSSAELPQCGSCEVSLPVSGTNFFGSTQNTANDQLFPKLTIVASDLSVHLDTAPGGAATRTFVIFFRSDPSHSLRCDVPPGSVLLMDAANGGNAAPSKFQFSWRATTQR